MNKNSCDPSQHRKQLIKLEVNDWIKKDELRPEKVLKRYEESRNQMKEKRIKGKAEQPTLLTPTTGPPRRMANA